MSENTERTKTAESGHGEHEYVSEGLQTQMCKISVGYDRKIWSRDSRKA